MPGYLPPPIKLVVALCEAGFVVVIFEVLIFGIFEEEAVILLLCCALALVLFVLAAKDNVPNSMGDTIIIRIIAIVMVTVCSIFIYLSISLYAIF